MINVLELRKAKLVCSYCIDNGSASKIRSFVRFNNCHYEEIEPKHVSNQHNYINELTNKQKTNSFFVRFSFVLRYFVQLMFH